MCMSLKKKKMQIIFMKRKIQKSGKFEIKEISEYRIQQLESRRNKDFINFIFYWRKEVWFWNAIWYYI